MARWQYAYEDALPADVPRSSPLRWRTDSYELATNICNIIVQDSIIMAQGMIRKQLTPDAATIRAISRPLERSPAPSN